MPWEVHRGERYVRHSAVPLPQLLKKSKQPRANTNLRPSNPPLPILRYKCNHDLESLMWVALYVVFRLVAWPAAQELWPKIFTNTPRPSEKRERFFTTPYVPVDSYHPQLSGFPDAFEAIRDSLWSICDQFEPRQKDYRLLFNIAISAFSEFLAVVDEKPNIVPFVQRSGQANVGTSQSVTTTCVTRVRTTLLGKRSRSSTSDDEGM